MALTFRPNNDRPDLTGTLTYTGTVTLTGATVTLSAATEDGTLGINDQSCTVSIDTDAQTIDYTYLIQSGDLPRTGKHKVWVTVTYSDGDEEDIQVGTINVKQPYAS